MTHILISSLSLCAFLITNGTLFGAEVGDKRVSKAFVHFATNNAIIEIQEYNLNPHADAEGVKYKWLASGYYFGRADRGFYKIFNNVGAGTDHIATSFRMRYTFAAPLARNLQRSGQMVFDYEVISSQDGVDEIAGSVNVTCDGGTACLMSSNARRDALTAGIVSGDIVLHQTPDLKKLIEVYQFKSQPLKYLVIESEPFPLGYDRIAVMVISGGGAPTFLTATRLYNQPDVNTLYDFNDGTKIVFDQKTKTYLFGSEPVTLLRKEQVSVELLEKLGLPNSRYTIPTAHTPCELINNLE